MLQQYAYVQTHHNYDYMCDHDVICDNEYRNQNTALDTIWSNHYEVCPCIEEIAARKLYERI